jgi:hydroxyacylglutathione hydrolase
MHFRQFYLGCLAHASYFIGSGDEAAVIDPQRDVDIYIDEARAQGSTIRHVIETHLHADFVSGHLELAERTGAQVYFGSSAHVKFPFTPVHDGDEIRFGEIILRFLETPGHTPESLSVLVFDTAESSQVPYGVLTGDALFIGDVGRPDLLGSRMAPGTLAGMLYDSLHEKLLKLPDEVRVFPAHGAGSMCGRNISSEKASTIGHERQFNYALQPMSRDDFIRLTTADLPEAPEYFSRDAQINLEGPSLLDHLPHPEALSASRVVELQHAGHVVLDTRPAPQFATGHIPRSLYIGLAGQFASWAGSLIRSETPVILVGENAETVREARIRLARVGLENVSGYLEGGVLAWSHAGLPLASIEQISVEELRHRMEAGETQTIVDVRRLAEWQNGHIEGARHISLNHLTEQAPELDHHATTAVLCAGGYRSSIATSLLEQQGFERISNVVGGMTAWSSAGLPVVQ